MSKSNKNDKVLLLYCTEKKYVFKWAAMNCQ